MAKFFLVLTIILAGAAAGIGYVKIYPEIVAVKKDLTEKTAALSKANSDLAHTKDLLTDAKKDATDTHTKLDTANAAIQTLTADKDALTKQVSDAQAQVADLTDKLAKETALYNAAVGNKTGSAPPGTAEAEFQKQISDLKAKVAEDSELQKTLQKQADDAKTRLDDLNKQIEAKKKIMLQPGVQGLVMAVNPGWNFVVVSVGDRQGAVANGEMLVKRGDALIGKLKITTVNPATSIADIVPDSVAKGQRVLPGDEVIFTGKTITP